VGTAHQNPLDDFHFAIGGRCPPYGLHYGLHPRKKTKYERLFNFRS